MNIAWNMVCICWIARCTIDIGVKLHIPGKTQTKTIRNGAKLRFQILRYHLSGSERFVRVFLYSNCEEIRNSALNRYIAYNCWFFFGNPISYLESILIIPKKLWLLITNNICWNDTAKTFLFLITKKKKIKPSFYPSYLFSKYVNTCLSLRGA